MSAHIINSEASVQSFIGDVRELFRQHKYLKVSVKAGKDRSLDQNSISHLWYEQLSRELKENDALGWKCFCKLHFGVPILRSEDEDFRVFYEAIKRLDYEQKIASMKFIPVTSLMTKPQLSKYLEDMQEEFIPRGVFLEFPKECK